jgi:hypothetical protein
MKGTVTMSHLYRSAATVVATALLEIEPRLRKIRGHWHLPALRTAMAMARIINQVVDFTNAALPMRSISTKK